MSDDKDVPPAGGEVEVLGRVLYPLGKVKSIGGQRSIRTYEELTKNSYPDAWREGEEVVDRAHVTRLTAERNGLLAEIEFLKSECKDYSKIYLEACTAEQALKSELAVCQQQLTKARECIAEVHALAFNSGATIYSDAPSYIVDIRNVLYAHQSTPAAKGNE